MIIFLANIPDKSEYISLVETGNVINNYSPERYIINLLNKKIIDKLNPRKKLFFTELLEVLLSNELFYFSNISIFKNN